MSVSLSNGLVLSYIPDFSHITDEQKELWKEWITALRSGEYKQGYRSLKRKDYFKNKCAFCCLGVLCDLIVKKRIGAEWIIGEYDTSLASSRIYFNNERMREPEIEAGHLPGGLIELCGLPDRAGFEVKWQSRHDEHRRDYNYDLIILNDTYLATFSDIAIILETAMNGGIGVK